MCPERMGVRTGEKFARQVGGERRKVRSGYEHTTHDGEHHPVHLGRFRDVGELEHEETAKAAAAIGGRDVDFIT